MSDQCSMCRFWVPIEDEQYRFSTPSPLDAPSDIFNDPKSYEQAREEAWPGPWGTCGRQDYPGSPMFTNDASDYFSALRTRAEHHCAAHEPTGDL